MNKHFKTAVAIVSAAVMLLSFAACGEKPEDKTTSAVQTTEENATAVNATEAETSEQTSSVQEPTGEASTVQPETETETDAPTTAAATTVKVTTTKAATTKAATTKATTTKAAAVTAPTEKAAILALYNTASAKVSQAKPGFKKSTVTKIPSLEMGALAKLDIVRTTVGDFLGEGSSNVTVAKGKSNASSYVKSTLKAADISKAACKLSADKKYYEITLTVVNETNPLKGKSALGRFTNDFKDQKEIKSGIGEAGASAESITMKTTSVVITAKISVADSRFSSLKYSIKTDAKLTGVKYTIIKVSSAAGKIDTSVNYSSFVY